MKRLLRVCWVLAVFLVMGRVAVAELRVGAASATVNPPNGTHLGGYGHGRATTGVHDNLYAKAVVFDDGETPMALVVVDSVGLQYPTINAIRARAAELTTAVSIPAERVIVTSTHSHCSPDCIGIYGAAENQSGVSPEYMKSLIESTAQTVAAAASKRQPARLVHASTVCDGWAVNDSEPELVDHSVTILQCLAHDGASIATLTNFACHPTVLDGDTTVCSADWPGAFYKDMGNALPGEHLFLQGCIGGWVQPVTPERTFALAEKYGSDLAVKTLEALEQPRRIRKTRIRFARRVFAMPCSNEGFQQLSQAGLLERKIADTVETEVAWFAIGPAQFATHPGETSPAHGFATKEMMSSGPKFVLGLGLDELGYILKKDYFRNTANYPHADYLTRMSPGPDAEDVMLATLRAIIPSKLE